MISFSVSRHVPLGLCFLLLFHGCLAQLSPLRKQPQFSPLGKPQQCLRGRSECQIDQITAREPNRVLVSEAGVSEFWDSFGDDELECAGVEAVRHTINPKGLLLPYYPSAPELVYVVRGKGLQGTVLPGCPETFETSFESEGGRGQFFDKHQRVYRYKEGDILALPAGTVHWTYNDGDTPIVTIVLRDISNVANQLDSNFRKFFLAGNPQSMQLQQGSRVPGQERPSGSWGPSWQSGEHGSKRPWWQHVPQHGGSSGQRQPSGQPGERYPGGSTTHGERQPWGASERPGGRQPWGTSERPGEQQPWGTSTRPDERQPWGTSTRPDERQPWGTSTRPGGRQPWGTSERPGGRQPWGTSERPGGRQPWGTSERPAGRQPWGTSERPAGRQPWGTSERPGGRQPISERPDERQPWGSSDRPDERQPWGTSKRPGGQQPWGSSDRPGGRQPWGSSYRPDERQPWGSSDRPDERQPWGSSERPDERQPWGSSDRPGGRQPWGTSERPGGRQPWGTSERPSERQPWGTSERPSERQPTRPSRQPEERYPWGSTIHPSQQPGKGQPWGSTTYPSGHTGERQPTRPSGQPGQHPSKRPGQPHQEEDEPSYESWGYPGQEEGKHGYGGKKQEDPCEVCRRIKGERGETEPCANCNDLWRQEEQGQRGYNIFSGFDDIILEEIFKVESDTIRKLQGEYDNRGLIVNAENFQVLVPEEQEQQKSSQGGRGGSGRTNGIEQTLCSTQLSANIASPARADVYNPRGGRISNLNSHKLPVLNALQLSAERGVLYKNAVLAPHYNLNAHSIIYVTSGSSRLQIVKNNGSPVFDDVVREGQLIVVPQDFAVIKKAGNEGCEWVAFKTNDNAITTQLAGRFSFIRALPEEVLLNSYDISREQAKSLKYSRQEGVILSPRSESTTKKAKNALLTALFG